MIPYAQHALTETDCDAVARVLNSERLTQGPTVELFEASLTSATNAEHAVAVSSGTAALEVALLALGAGPGDEVLVPSLSFLASANSILRVGAKPVFVDINRRTLCADPDDLDRKICERTVGAVAVHFSGHPAAVDQMRSILGPNRFILEDAAHALGARAADGTVGQLGDAACFSFHPAKHVTTGEGGAITTNRPEIAERCRRLREHGVERCADRRLGLGLPEAYVREETGGWVYEMHWLSANYRLSDLGAALGVSQLKRLDQILSSRHDLAERYRSMLSEDTLIEVPDPLATVESAWHLYPVRLRSAEIRGGRAAVYDAMHARGIGVQIHYIPIHLQPYYRNRFGTGWGDLPETEAAYLELLSLPLFPSLAEKSQDAVVETLRSVLKDLAR